MQTHVRHRVRPSLHRPTRHVHPSPSSPHPGPLQAPYPFAATTKPALEPHPQSQPSPLDDTRALIRTSILHPPGLVIPGVAFAHPFALVRTCTPTPVTPTHPPPPPTHHARDRAPNGLTPSPTCSYTLLCPRGCSQSGTNPHTS
ncbi:hypothetical protein K439DRAFT_1634754 [Ramaria rubella]|nr:hypothetical protein K439DRAFT_1634754 [Ramaria rubella]